MLLLLFAKSAEESLERGFGWTPCSPFRHEYRLSTKLKSLFGLGLMLPQGRETI